MLVGSVSVVLLALGLFSRLSSKVFSHLSLQNLVQDWLQKHRHSPVSLEQLLDLLTVDLNLKSDHRRSAWLLIGLTSKPDRKRWLLLSRQYFYTKVGIQLTETNHTKTPFTILGRVSNLSVELVRNARNSADLVGKLKTMSTTIRN